MGRTLLTVAIVLASGSAMASSIDVVRGNRTGNDSIVPVSCAACPPLKGKAKLQQTTPSLAAGTQDISIREVNGKKQIQRTEAWLGGSPVTFVSSNAVWLPQEPSIPSTAENTLPGTDAVKTSAVSPVTPNSDGPQNEPQLAGVPLRPAL
ncbi:plant virulence effector HPE1-like domain-containing protein [Agrobacterium bohemicum]|uniref:Uncharacterized protein n=1 Tax=Agrobacterium bohemicum TaxID=2052828 RepID=A0A135P909_9HYPH|nr:hypothetical protein ATO67_15945 [Agrobacterium bohemicum]